MTQQLIQRGQAAINSGNMLEAAQWFERALEINPKDSQSLACFGQSQCWLGQKKQGLVNLREAGRLIARAAKKSKNINDLISMTGQLQYWNDFAGALELARQAVQIGKNDVRSFQMLASSYARLNKKQQAISACQQALRLAPKNVELNILMADLDAREKKYPQARQRMERILLMDLSAEQIFRAEKELANILDKMGEYKQVFAHLHRAAEVAIDIPEIQKQDAELVPKMLKNNQLDFTEKLLRRWDGIQFEGHKAPVFVLGFMRSGTTLTQEVLGAHPEVFVADEAGLLCALRKELDRLVASPASCAEQLAMLDLEGIKHLRQFYWRSVENQFGHEIGRQYFIDKTTMGIIDLGLINAVFPDAKVVFVMRDPRDVCLSCFMQVMEPTSSTVQLLSWQKTVDFYRQSMDWWLYIRQYMSLEYYVLRYEDAVTQFEPAFQEVFEFLQLTWDPTVIEFHQYAAKKTIISPSFNQVTQPLYSTSTARWKNYADEYESVLTKLQPYISFFGYQSDEISN